MIIITHIHIHVDITRVMDITNVPTQFISECIHNMNVRIKRMIANRHVYLRNAIKRQMEIQNNGEKNITHKGRLNYECSNTSTNTMDKRRTELRSKRVNHNKSAKWDYRQYDIHVNRSDRYEFNKSKYGRNTTEDCKYHAHHIHTKD